MMKNRHRQTFMSPLYFFGIILIILKLAEAIDWAWWIVLLPFYIGFAIIIGFFAITFGLAIILWIAGAVLIIAAAIWDTARGLIRRR